MRASELTSDKAPSASAWAEGRPASTGTGQARARAREEPARRGALGLLMQALCPLSRVRCTLLACLLVPGDIAASSCGYWPWPLAPPPPRPPAR
eukprot:366097-Chlamydomonas_euryale.AAC.40